MTSAATSLIHTSISAAVIRITISLVGATSTTFFDAPQPDPNALPLSPNYLVANTAPVMVNGQIWMATNTVDTGTGRGSIHWLRIDAASTTIIEEGYIGDATQSFLFPSIAANHDGDVVIGFNAVGPGPGQFASSYAVVGKTAGRKTVFGDPMLLKRGRASYQLPTDVGTSRAGATTAARRSTPRTIRRSGPSSRSPSTRPTGPRRLPRCTSNTESCWRWAIPCAGGKRRSTAA